MKTSQKIAVTILLSSILACPMIGLSAEKKDKGKPYPLKTCVVSDEKLGGDMGDPYVFTHEGREIKLCCSGCLEDFNKNPKKYIKKLEKAEKKEKK